MFASFYRFPAILRAKVFSRFVTAGERGTVEAALARLASAGRASDLPTLTYPYRLSMEITASK
jgi:hypothetical protein